MKVTSKTAIRLSVTPEVSKALRQAKRMYPTLSDPEILKLGLSKIVTSDSPASDIKEREYIRKASAYSLGEEYLSNREEDGYSLDMGNKVNFS